MHVLRNSSVGRETKQFASGTVKNIGAACRRLDVALFGFDQPMWHMLRLFFQTHCQDHYSVAAEGENADLSIIDLDGYQGKALWSSQSERHPDRPCILLSVGQVDAGDGELVSKPLRIKALQAALDKIRVRFLHPSQRKAPQSAVAAGSSPQRTAEGTLSPLSRHPAKAATARQKAAQAKPSRERVELERAAPCLHGEDVYAYIGSAPDINLQDPQQVLKAQYDPERFLIGHILRASRLAVGENRPVRMTTQYGSLTLQPGSNRILVEIQNRHLRSLAALPIDDRELSLSVLTPEQAPKTTDPASWRDLDAFIWNLTLVTCRGRLPLGTDPTAPVSLQNWPNLTRLQLFPHALRIAALWINKPTSLQDTAAALDIPQRFVFTFYSAVQNLGLTATDSTEPVHSQPEKTRVERPLLSRILKHLRLSQGPELQHS